MIVGLQSAHLRDTNGDAMEIRVISYAGRNFDASQGCAAEVTVTGHPPYAYDSTSRDQAYAEASAAWKRAVDNGWTPE